MIRKLTHYSNKTPILSCLTAENVIWKSEEVVFVTSRVVTELQTTVSTVTLVGDVYLTVCSCCRNSMLCVLLCVTLYVMDSEGPRRLANSLFFFSHKDRHCRVFLSSHTDRVCCYCSSCLPLMFSQTTTEKTLWYALRGTFRVFVGGEICLLAFWWEFSERFNRLPLSVLSIWSYSK